MTVTRVYERGEPHSHGYGALGIPLIVNAQVAEILPDGVPYMLSEPALKPTRSEPSDLSVLSVKDAVNANAAVLGVLCELAVVADQEAVTVWKTT